MKLIFEDTQARTIQGKERIVFSSFPSFHLLTVTARAKSQTQLPGAKRSAGLNMVIDGEPLPNSATFSGSQLRGLTQTLHVLTFLPGEEHTVSLETTKPQATAALEHVAIFAFDPEPTLILESDSQAEDGDRRPWITLVLKELPLLSFTPTIIYARRQRDSDDVKIIIDGRTQRNLQRTIKYLFWRFAGSLLPKKFPSKTEAETFSVDLPLGVHVIEFWADRMPTLKTLALDFGATLAPSVRLPTVNDPKWTGDFNDDPSEILLARIIFGESRNQSPEAKIAVGWVVKNRVGKATLIDPRKTYDDYYDVILDEGQFASLTDANVRPRLEDPLNTQDDGERNAWHESYRIATEIIGGRTPDPTDGALFFHDNSMTTREFLTVVPRAAYIKQIDRMLFYGVKP